MNSVVPVSPQALAKHARLSPAIQLEVSDTEAYSKALRCPCRHVSNRASAMLVFLRPASRQLPALRLVVVPRCRSSKARRSAQQNDRRPLGYRTCAGCGLSVPLLGGRQGPAGEGFHLPLSSCHMHVELRKEHANKVALQLTMASKAAGSTPAATAAEIRTLDGQQLLHDHD